MGHGSGKEADTPSAVAEGRLLNVVGALAGELAGNGAAAGITLDSRLDRDLGLDSLARAELFIRVERAFRVALSEQLLATAQTPRDLLRAVLSGGTGVQPAEPLDAPIEAPPVREGSTPDRARTLLEVLDHHIRHHPDRPHVHLSDGDGELDRVTYRQLKDGALQIAAGLAQRNLEPGESVAIMLATGTDYLFSFFGVLLAGGVPVPIYPPARPAQIEDHLRRHDRILNNAMARVLITLPEAVPVSRLLKARVASLGHVVTPAEVRGDAGAFTPAAPAPGDTAFLQYTSGSTGNPKGVVLSHENLLANVRAFGRSLKVDPTDVCVSWLPLYHDMGLIGAWLGSLYFAVPLVLMSPLHFLARPSRWLWALHRYRATISAAPNFAYELCLRKVEDGDIKGLDLSSWRLALNGAERVSPETLVRFMERFGKYGFRAEAMAPVYGLAECSVGLSFPPLGRRPVVDRIRRTPFEREGRAIPAGADEPNALTFVAGGQPLPGHQIRVVDPTGRELPDREEGRIQFTGPSATSGYFRNPEATAALFKGEWLETGDLGYTAAGDIVITRRAKDVIIRAGRNIFPHELDEAVGNLEGVRSGCVATFSAADRVTGTERLVIMAETRETEEAARARLRSRINDVITDVLGEPADDVVLAPPHTVLKTSSGKVRREDSRKLYEKGRIRRSRPAVWWQLVRLFASGIIPSLRRAWRLMARTVFAGYAWSLFGLIAAVGWPVLILPLTHRARWRVARGAARLLAWATGTPLLVSGREHLPDGGPYVVVANHASYLDAFIMTAALPRPVSFVAKAELRHRLITRLPLERLGVSFVERFDLQRGVADARKLAGDARHGKALMFFPEGTFYRMPGLQPFHMGAFVAAAEAGAPVVPVIIRGARSMLRAGTWFPSRGRISVIIEAPIRPRGNDWNAAVHLRDEARNTILERLGEPDLGDANQPV